MAATYILRRRRGYLVLTALFVIALLIVLVVNDTGRLEKLKRQMRVRYNYHLSINGPPTYAELRRWEASLPQHNLSLPFPEGKSGRYVKFSNQIRWLGWNNVFSDVLMCAHLAYISDRAYVFQDYYWAPEHYQWPKEKYVTFEARTPLPAIVSGPVAGGPFEAGDASPRAVSESWFDVVCPRAERRYLNTRDIKPPVADAPGIAVLQHWQRILHEAPERCIEVVSAEGHEDSFPQVFDLGLWSSRRLLSLWDVFSHSPISRLLRPSPIVTAAVERNAHRFAPEGPRPPHPTVRDPFGRMLAIHLRRGDYEGHCHALASYKSGYYGWGQFPHLLDRFEAEPEGTPGKNERMVARCYPDLAAVVKKLAETRRDYLAQMDGGALDVVYILTNEKSAWIDELGDALRGDGWPTVVSSRNLMLNQEQRDVSMAVDMEIARRAEVFIGNGWSSLTSNIVYQRLLDERDPITIRFT